MEKVYTIPLAKAYRSPKPKRANRAISVIKRFLERHTKAERVVIGQSINEAVWEKSRKRPPRRIRVSVDVEEGVARAEMVGEEKEAAKGEEKKAAKSKKKGSKKAGEKGGKGKKGSKKVGKEEKPPKKEKGGKKKKEEKAPTSSKSKRRPKKKGKGGKPELPEERKPLSGN